jgi:hypothetical protein
MIIYRHSLRSCPACHCGTQFVRCGNQTTLEHSDGIDEPGDTQVLLYTCVVPENVLGYYDLIDDEIMMDELEEHIGDAGDPGDVFKMSTSPDVYERALLIEIIGDYFGWDSLDPEPECIELAELMDRWSTYTDIHCTQN